MADQVFCDDEEEEEEEQEEQEELAILGSWYWGDFGCQPWDQ